MANIFINKQSDKDELIALCCRLVEARSENPPGDIRAAALEARRYLETRGLVVEEIARVPEKPNLVSTIEGSAAGPHLILNGHLDTVTPGDMSQWTVPPYAATRRDGRIYGLGTGNMKAGSAALTAAFAVLARNREQFRGRVSLALVADETVFGPDGAGYVLERCPDLFGDGVICGEGPGAMSLGVAEKGLLWLELASRVPAGQGMLTTAGQSAITRLAEVIVKLDCWNYEQVIPPPELMGLRADAGEHGFRLSVNVGTIRGGHFVSQKADHAATEVDFRVPPGLTIGDVERRVRELCGSEVVVRRLKGWNPNWSSPSDPLVEAVAAAAQSVRRKASAPTVRLPASDASRWRARGIPAICFGPQPLLASGVDDYVDEQDVIDSAEIYVKATLMWLNR